MGELLDLTALQTRRAGLKYFLHQLHQEVEAEDVHNSHRKDCSIREVDNRTKAGCGTDHDEDTEDDLPF